MPKTQTDLAYVIAALKVAEAELARVNDAARAVCPVCQNRPSVLARLDRLEARIRGPEAAALTDLHHRLAVVQRHEARPRPKPRKVA